MPNEESREQSEIRERLVRLEMKIDGMSDLRDIADAARETALEATNIGKSAHWRMDEMADHQRWLWRTAGGAILAAAIAFLSRLVGS